jgi:hypothetical protein
VKQALAGAVAFVCMVNLLDPGKGWLWCKLRDYYEAVDNRCG